MAVMLGYDGLGYIPFRLVKAVESGSVRARFVLLHCGMLWQLG